MRKLRVIMCMIKIFFMYYTYVHDHLSLHPPSKLFGEGKRKSSGKHFYQIQGTCYLKCFFKYGRQ